VPLSAISEFEDLPKNEGEDMNPHKAE
jgi:hypothetical protein